MTMKRWNTKNILKTTKSWSVAGIMTFRLFREDLETVEVTVNRYENFRSKTPSHLWPAECPPIKRMNWN